VHSNIDWRDGELEKRGWQDQHVSLGDDPAQWIHKLRAGKEGAENVLAIDESAMIFHVWDQVANKGRDRVIFDTLVMSRKLGLETYFITQHEDNVAVPIRRMAQEIRRCIAVAKIPFFGPWIAKVKGPFLIRSYSTESMVRLDQHYERYDEEAGSCYATDAKKGAAKTIPVDATRKVQTTPKVPFKAWLFLIIPICGLGFLAYTIWSFDKKTGKITEKQPDKPIPESKTLAERISEPIRQQASYAQKIGELPPRWPFNDTNIEEAYGVRIEKDKIRVVLAVHKKPQEITVYTEGGDTWKIGKQTPSGRIVTIIDAGSEYLAITNRAKTFYLRQRTYEEKRAEQEYYRKLNQQRSVNTTKTDTPINLTQIPNL